MKLQTIKSPSEIKLPGLRVETDVVDGTIKGVSIFAPGNNELLLRFGMDSYTFVVQRIAPPKMVKRNRVAGHVLGLSVDEMFEDVYAARARRDEITAAGGVASLEEGVEVPDPAEADPAEAEADDGLPF